MATTTGTKLLNISTLSPGNTALAHFTSTFKGRVMHYTADASSPDLSSLVQSLDGDRSAGIIDSEKENVLTSTIKTSMESNL